MYQHIFLGSGDPCVGFWGRSGFEPSWVRADPVQSQPDGRAVGVSLPRHEPGEQDLFLGDSRNEIHQDDLTAGVSQSMVCNLLLQVLSRQNNFGTPSVVLYVV